MDVVDSYQINLKKLRKKHIEKISNALYKRYGNIFKEKGYTLQQVIKDIEDNFTDKEVKVFNMSTGLSKFEKIALEKVAKLKKVQNETVKSKQEKVIKKDKSVKNEISNNNNNTIKPIQSNEEHIKNIVNETYQDKQIKEEQIQSQYVTENNNNNDNNNQDEVDVDKLLSEEASPFPSEKLLLLKLKQQDKWAKLAKSEYEKYFEEKENEKFLNEQKKLNQKQYLDQQIKEKELYLQNIKQKEEATLHHNQKYYPIVSYYDSEITPKITEVPSKFQQPTLIEQHMKIQKENQKYTQQVKKEIDDYQKEEIRKLQEKKALYLKIQKENELTAKLKQSSQNKYKDYKYNKKLNDDNYDYPFGKNDINYNRRWPVDINTNNNNNNNSNNIKEEEINNLLKLYETEKLQQPKEEVNNLSDNSDINYNYNNISQREQKLKMMEDYKQGLDQQISENNYIKNPDTNSLGIDEFYKIQQINEDFLKD